MKKVLLHSLILFVSLALAHPISAQGDGFPRTVTDDSGAAVSIPARPRIVATVASDPILNRLLPPESIRTESAWAADWSGVGLLVIQEGYAAAYPGLVESAAGARIPVYRTAPITSLDGWRAAVRRLGQATGYDDRAQSLINHLDRRLAAIQARIGGGPPVRVLILTPEGYSFGQGTLIDELIAGGGGINAAAGYGDYRQIDDQTIRALAPDVILLSPAWADPGAFVANPAYAEVPAVRSGRVIRLPFSPTAPPDPAAALLVLAILLHPPAMWLP
jgi:iron complex transport system substrate-binding protein